MSSEGVDKVKESVKVYYGKTLKSSDDLQSNACKLGGNVRRRGERFETCP